MSNHIVFSDPYHTKPSTTPWVTTRRADVPNGEMQVHRYYRTISTSARMHNGMSLNMSPDQARAYAHQILELADEAEKSPTQRLDPNSCPHDPFEGA